MNLDADTIRLLSVLSLLKKEPKRFIELWNSGCFRSEEDLKWALNKLLYTCCIERLGTNDYGIYVLTAYGIALLKSYPTFDLSIVKAQNEGVIQPLRRE